MSRRSFLAKLAVAAVGTPTVLFASTPVMTVHASPGLACCAEWVEHMRSAGFDARMVEANDLAGIRSSLVIPHAGSQCHIAEVGGYVVEGHVPGPVVRRLLSERPGAIGVAVGATPSGATNGSIHATANGSRDVVLYGPSFRKVYARFEGAPEFRLRF
jgi:hypothetical protein